MEDSRDSVAAAVVATLGMWNPEAGRFHCGSRINHLSAVEGYSGVTRVTQLLYTFHLTVGSFIHPNACEY